MTEHGRDEGQQQPEGMGAHPHGPSFESPVSPARSSPLGTPPPPDYSRQFEPPKGARGPLIITLIVLTVVALVVGTASVIAHLQDKTQIRPAPTPTAAGRSPAATPDGRSIAFSSPEADGRLTVLHHQWTAAGDQPPITGTYLVLKIRLEVTDGSISSDPGYFELFDAQGRLTDSTTEGAPDPVLPSTILYKGGQASGFIAFDVIRGDVTLVLTNRRSAVTALKIPG